MDKFREARKEETEYHDNYYREVELFEEDTWLESPEETVIEAFEMLNLEEASILDLGCGVGRNSIPIAQQLKAGSIVCVDLLESALTILQENARKYEVEPFINPVQADVEHYKIDPGHFDMIIASSSLEHVSSEDSFTNALDRMKSGTKNKGINCILMNTSVKHLEIESDKKQDGMIELNVKTTRAFEWLHESYKDWDILTTSCVPKEIEEFKGGKDIIFMSNLIHFVAQKC